jgi:high-affinity K+ transport system ATPase subunit B
MTHSSRLLLLWVAVCWRSWPHAASSAWRSGRRGRQRHVRVLQEWRAERAAQRLHDLLPRRATLVRDGREVEVDAIDVVVGDLMVLAAGDRLCADVDVVNSDALTLDTSMLTGESVPTGLAEGDRAEGGTFVVDGDGGRRPRLGLDLHRAAGPTPQAELAPKIPLAPSSTAPCASSRSGGRCRRRLLP